MLNNRVKETTITEGVGNIVLAGAVTNFQTFNAAFGTDKRFPYFIIDDTNNDWEYGIGYLSASTTLVREEVVESTNSNATVNFSAGTKDVFVGSGSLNNYTASSGYNSFASRGQYQVPTNFIRINSTRALSSGRIFYVPIFISRPTKIDRLATRVTTGAGSAPPTNDLTLGIYDVNPADGRAGKLIASVTGLDPSTSGLKFGSITEIVLPAGWYYSAMFSDVAPTLESPDASITMPHPFSCDSSLSGGAQLGFYFSDGNSSLPTDANDVSYSATSQAPIMLVGHS